MSGDSSRAPGRRAYIGWYAAGLTLLVIFAACAGVWFIYHPL